MTDILDWEIWAGLLLLTALLYTMKWIQSRRKRTVYRISSESLKRSQQVIMHTLPIVENTPGLIDDTRLPYPKDNIKSAAKILSYYYWKEHRMEELGRVKNCFISLARFQTEEMDDEIREKRAKQEEVKLTREFECYITHSPFKTGVRKGGKAA